MLSFLKGLFGAAIGDSRNRTPQLLVSFGDEHVVCKRSNGVEESVRWDDLRAVLIETNDSGPLGNDVLWLLIGRDAKTDLQLPVSVFLNRLFEMHAYGGMILLQSAGSVPDTLEYAAIEKAKNKYDILRQNGWLLTFDLPHDGEYAERICPDRAHLERVLADPVIASRELP